MKKNIYPAFAVIATLLLCSFAVLFGCNNNSSPKPKIVEFGITVDPTIENGTVSVSKPKAKEGDTITITPLPDNEYSLNQLTVWKKTDTNTKVNVSASNTFTMPAFDVVVSATFIWDNAPDFDITIDPDLENGNITSDLSTAKETQQVKLTVTPESGYRIISKPVVTGEDTGDDVSVSGSAGSFTFAMPAENVFVTAAFELIPEDGPDYALTIDSGISNGTISVSKNTAKEGDTITITPLPSTNYTVDKYIVFNKDDLAEIVYEGSSNTFTMPAFDVLVSVIFVLNTEQTFTVTIDPNMEFGWITFSPAKPKEGATVTLTVEGDWGFEIDFMPIVTGESSGDDVSVTIGGNKDTFTFTMPGEDVLVTATFVPEDTLYYDITLVQTAGGTITVNRETAYEGAEILITAVPDENYWLLKLLVSGATVSISKDSEDLNLRKFIMPAADITVTPEFEDEQDTLDRAMATLSVPSAVNTATLTLPELSGEDFEDIVLSIESSDESAVTDGGNVICGNSGVGITMKIILTLGGAELEKDFPVTVNYPHTFGIWQTDATQHWHACTRVGCGYVSDHEDHDFDVVSQAKGTWVDGISASVCKDCNYSSGVTTDYVTGFSFETGATVSRINNAQFLTLTPNVNGADSMVLTLHMQLRNESPYEQTAHFYFVAPRETDIEKDFLGSVEIPPYNRTFTFTVELSDFFIPLMEDRYGINVEVGGVTEKITRANGFNVLTNIKNNAAYLYTVNYDDPSTPTRIRIYRDADVTVSGWTAANILLTGGAGSAIATVSGSAYINGSNATDTTWPRDITIWFTNESNPTERYAETIVNTSTSADTRNFTFVIDLSNSSIYSSGDWYKFVIGIDEGGGQVSKLHITAAAGQQISDNGAAARNFSNGSTSNTLQSVDGFRIVSEWGQVHLRR